MMDEMVFGLFDDKGNLVRDTQVCALTGRPTEPGDALVRVPGSNYFYRLEAYSFRTITPEQKAAIEAGVPKSYSAPKVVVKDATKEN